MSLYRVLFISMGLIWLAACSAPESSEDTLAFDWVDTGLSTDPRFGKGIEIRVKPNSMPEGGIGGELMASALLGICNTLAPQAIPFIAERTKFTDPEFISVRALYGAQFAGVYVFQVFKLDDTSCGEKLN